MSVDIQYECTRVPVTASACCGSLYVAAEGPFLRIYAGSELNHVVSKQIFQAQAVHGIAILSESVDHIKLIVWGGLLVRTLEFSRERDEKIQSDSWIFSEVAKAPDWILDLSLELKPLDTNKARSIAAVTAHNALLKITVCRIDGVPVISISELTASSRSILYSAHLLWESSDRVLVAAGTAFGEIIYWSWSRNPQKGPQSRTHRVFLGHEGSIFGVQISKELAGAVEGRPQRLLASCSDDRTIRIWDISNLSLRDGENAVTEELDIERKQHTGFTNESFDPVPSSSDCLAVGWGHISRVWTVQFLESATLTAEVFLLSTGEDATSRTWHFTPNDDWSSLTPGMLPYKLPQLDCAAYHSGKNIWSSSIQQSISVSRHVIMGGADSKITACSLGNHLPQLSRSVSASFDFTVAQVASQTQTQTKPDIAAVAATKGSHKSSKVAEFFRSYAFIDESSYLLTTNSGKIYLGSISLDGAVIESTTKSNVTFIGHSEDLNGYSICTGISSIGIVFVAGVKGSIYAYQRDSKILSKLLTVDGKVGHLFAVRHQHQHQSLDTQSIYLLATVTGKNTAQLLCVKLNGKESPAMSKSIPVPTTEFGAGVTITSMEYISTDNDDYLFLGTRQGTIAVYRIKTSVDSQAGPVPIKILERVHDKETVTAMTWLPSNDNSPSGHLVSTGRAGRLIIHSMDFSNDSIILVHNLVLPVGPNIEGVYFSKGHLLIYGFSSKNFVLYDTSAEEELMGVDTGGAHRSWDFQPSTTRHGGGTLVWTRASSMHVCHQPVPSHQVVRPGGHGREIKAVAVSPLLPQADFTQRQLIATGAEDTDIKIFDYEKGNLICRRTLRKHRTGIQHLQWSEDGEYLFSSGGCEEFYIWKVTMLPAVLGGIGVACESVCLPESEHADLRLMSFHAQKRGTVYTIAMVFSDSNIRVYNYTPTAPQTPWQTVAKGTYFTSCLTQTIFLSPTLILTAGTDGHAVQWQLPTPYTNASPSSSSSPKTLTWSQPLRIHQSSSKTLATHPINRNTLIVSGGDDGTLSFLLATPNTIIDTATPTIDMTPPIIVTRAHASGITACAILALQTCSESPRYLVVTAGNDQWVRVWQVWVNDGQAGGDGLVSDLLEIRRLKRVKTSVADVSSMCILGDGQGVGGEDEAKVLICGVGMEVLRIR